MTEHSFRAASYSCRLYSGRQVIEQGLKEAVDRTRAKRAFVVAKAPGTRELLARLRKFRGRLPVTFKFDRLEANERR